MIPRTLSRGDTAALRRDRQSRAAADAECARAYRHAETLAIMLDRRAGDAGADPEAVRGIADRLHALIAETRALIGDPAVPIFNAAHECVGLRVSAPRPVVRSAAQ